MYYSVHACVYGCAPWFHLVSFCRASKVMTHKKHSLETSHNVQKCHDHEEQTKSEENGYCQCQHGTVQ